MRPIEVLISDLEYIFREGEFGRTYIKLINLSIFVESSNSLVTVMALPLP